MTRPTICILGRRGGERPGDLRIAHLHDDGRWRELSPGIPMLNPRPAGSGRAPRRWQTIYLCRDCGFMVISLTPP